MQVIPLPETWERMQKKTVKSALRSQGEQALLGKGIEKAAMDTSHLSPHLMGEGRGRVGCQGPGGPHEMGPSTQEQ